MRVWLAVIVAGGLVAAAVLGSMVRVARSADQASAPPLVGLVRSGSSWALRPLDPRALAPLAGGWSRPVPKGAVIVRSPLGTGVAATWDLSATTWKRGAVVVDARTGKVLRRYGPGGTSAENLYWLGSENASRAVLVRASFSCWSGGLPNGAFGIEYGLLGSGTGEDIEGGWADAVLPEAFVMRLVGYKLALYLPEGINEAIVLPQLPPPATPNAVVAGVVADVAHDRLYAITGQGAIAQIDDVRGSRSVSYHSVQLNGHSFTAVWAGQGRIALWGIDGLGTIDTRTWTTHPVAGPVSGVVATSYGFAAWNKSAPTGVTLYRVDGTRRFTVLAGKTVRSAEVAGRYLYVRADHRYAIDLAGGRLVGRVRDSTRIALPSYAAIP